MHADSAWSIFLLVAYVREIWLRTRSAIIVYIRTVIDGTRFSSHLRSSI
jgi:hypothetical protein